MPFLLCLGFIVGLVIFSYFFCCFAILALLQIISLLLLGSLICLSYFSCRVFLSRIEDKRIQTIGFVVTNIFIC